jgi:hypothetical protein
VCRGHHASITHLDFSADSKVLQSNCQGYELLFWNAATGEQNKSAISLRDVTWATWTCTLGWPVQVGFEWALDNSDHSGLFRQFVLDDGFTLLELLQGIWEPGMDGTDVNAVDKAKGLNVLIAGTDRSKVGPEIPDTCLDSGSKISERQ